MWPSKYPEKDSFSMLIPSSCRMMKLMLVCLEELLYIWTCLLMLLLQHDTLITKVFDLRVSFAGSGLKEQWLLVTVLGCYRLPKFMCKWMKIKSNGHVKDQSAGDLNLGYNRKIVMRIYTKR